MTKKDRPDYDILVWADVPGDESTKKAMPSWLNPEHSLLGMTSKDLGKRLKNAIENVVAAISETDASLKQYYVDELQLNFTVNASGGIELVGKVNAGAQSAVTVTLRRKDPREP